MVSPRFVRGLLVVGALLASAHTGMAARPGELDPSFNGGQPVLLDLARTVPRSTSFTAVAIDDGGNVLPAGSASDENGRTAVALARVGPNGALDSSFGSAGSHVVQLGLGAQGILSAATAIAARPGGGWLVMGQATASDDRRAMLVAAFANDGALDVGYGSGGSVRVQPAGMSPQETHGRGGAVDTDGSAFVAGLIDEGYLWAAISKVTPAGSVAVGFGNRPTVGTYANLFDQMVPGRSEANDAVVTPAGILVAGGTNDTAGKLQQLVFRLLPSGALDPGFTIGIVQAGDPGAATRSSTAYAVAVGPDGEVYVAGEATDGDSRVAMAVTRFTPAGVVDDTFASGGTRRVQTATGSGATSVAFDVLVQADGKVVLVASSANTTTSECVVVRLETNGDLDPTFGAGGIMRLPVGASSFARKAALCADGRSLVVVGASTDDDVTRGLVARVLLVDTAPACDAAPSITGARCRIAAIRDAVAAQVPAGKVSTRLTRALARGDARLGATDGLAGRPLRRKLRQALARVRQVRRLFASKAAGRVINDDQRAALRSQTDALVAELEALTGAP
jgi:uncharacterized delta-60 repeat protein